MAELLAAKRSTAPLTTINDLPIDILIHILSFLPILAAIETSYVSRKWRNLWHSLPSLHFDTTKYNYSYPTAREYYQRFAEFITQALLNRPATIPLRDFRLTFYYAYNHRHRSLVSSYIRYALDCNVEDVNLDFDVINNFSDEEKQDGEEEVSTTLYDFHLCVLRNRSVKRLTLCCCELIMPSTHLIRFESLRVLEFSAVVIADESLSELVLRCPNLESLTLHYLPTGNRKFRVISESLKFLHLSYYFALTEEEMESSIEIRTPNLAKIKLHHFYVANYIGDLSSVAEADYWSIDKVDYAQKCWNNAMNLLSGVENLSVQNTWLWLMYSKINSDECFDLKRLKRLELFTGCTTGDMLGLSLLLQRSPNLETLVLVYFYQTGEDASLGFLEKLNSSKYPFNTKSLQEVKWIRFRYTETEMYILDALRSEALKKVVLVPATVGETSKSVPIVLDPTASDWSSTLAALVVTKPLPGENPGV